MNVHSVVRAALLGFVVLLLLPGNARAAQPVSDDFDRANLNRAIWSFVNPLGDGWLRMVGADSGDAVVELAIPEGESHDPWQTNRSVRIMQPATDSDFEVEAYFQSEPTQRFQMQGVIVEQDQDNWLRFEFLHDGSTLRVFAARTVAGSSSQLFNANIDAGDASALRVTRVGDEWTVSYLDGGALWTQAHGAVAHEMTVTAVGPFVANHATSGPSPAFTAVVDAFQNTAMPVSPEDDGAPADVDGPLIHAVQQAPTGPTELTVAFATDEPSTGLVRIGRTMAYELGSFASGSDLTQHNVSIAGLTPGDTYQLMIEAQDAIGNLSATGNIEVVFTQPGAPVIDVWYGNEQTFGQVGQPQTWVNILGNVSDPDDDVASLSYQLNGSMQSMPLSIGPDGRRLLRDGDFNVDLATSDLVAGVNTVVISAVDSAGSETLRTVTVNYTPGTTWPLPYDVDWSTLSSQADIQSVGQVVDGKWGLEQIASRGDGEGLDTFVRTLEPGYDRLLAIGDRTWGDYEFEVPIIINTTPGGYGTGVLLRWDGHTDNPVAGWQPKSGWLPLGCIMWARPGKIELYGNGGSILDFQSRTLTPGTEYIFKGRIETIEGVGGLYSMKVWESGQPEPAGWDITGQETLSDPQFGSLVLISHMADASFGEVAITSLEPGPDVTPPTISDVLVSESQTTALITWATDEPADSTVEYGLTSSYGQSEGSSSFAIAHAVSLTGLEPNTEYQFRISSTDPSGNTATSANMMLTTDEAGELATISSDEFNDPTLDTSIWTFVDAPTSDGVLAMTGSQVSLSVPAGVEHQVWVNGVNVPRVVQFVNDGDFEVQFKADSEIVATFQEQGIVIEQDADSYLRFEFYSNSAGSNIFAAAIRDGVADVAINANVPLTAPFYMRVRREGDTWTQFYSDDGSNWIQGGVLVDPLVMSSIGLYAGNAIGASSPAHTALFDHFRNLRCPADVNGDGLVDPADFNAWIMAFNTQAPKCDQNGDGACTPADFNAWILNYNQGCG